MAIKVKHDGNATGTLTASGAGGKGRRRAEDAKLFLQIASQENMANRRIQAPHFIQAHAQSPGAAPLVHAPTGGSAPLMAAPGISQVALHAPPPSRTTFSPVTSPGGFKKGRRGQGGGAAAAGGRGGIAAGGAGQALKLVERNPKALRGGLNHGFDLVDDNGNVVRSYSDKQMENVVSRGDLGSTMDEIDQQAWFRFRGGKTEQELAEEQAQQEAVADAAKRQADANEFDRREGVKQANIRNNREAEIASQKELYEYKLTQQQKREIDAINNAYENARKSGNFTEDQLKEIARQRDARLMGIQPLATPKNEPNKPNIQTDASGRSWIESSPGKWTQIDDDAKSSRQAELDAKRQDALDARADKYELELMKPYTVMEPNEDGELQKVTKMRSQEEIDEIMKRRFPYRYPDASADGAGAQSQTPAFPNLAAGYSFMKSGDDGYEGQYVLDSNQNIVGFYGADGRRLAYGPNGAETRLEGNAPAPWEVQQTPQQPAPSPTPDAAAPAGAVPKVATNPDEAFKKWGVR